MYIQHLPYIQYLIGRLESGQIRVMAGAHSLATAEASWQIRKVRRQLPHPEYRVSVTPVNDVALFQVPKKKRCVSTISWPSHGSMSREKLDGDRSMHRGRLRPRNRGRPSPRLSMVAIVIQWYQSGSDPIDPSWPFKTKESRTTKPEAIDGCYCDPII